MVTKSRFVKHFQIRNKFCMSFCIELEWNLNYDGIFDGEPHFTGALDSNFDFLQIYIFSETTMS